MRWLVSGIVLLLGGCSLEGPGSRVSLLVLLPFALLALLLWWLARRRPGQSQDNEE